jgi:hypothetical protein
MRTSVRPSTLLGRQVMIAGLGMARQPGKPFAGIRRQAVAGGAQHQRILRHNCGTNKAISATRIFRRDREAATGSDADQRFFQLIASVAMGQSGRLRSKRVVKPPRENIFIFVICNAWRARHAFECEVG